MPIIINNSPGGGQYNDDAPSLDKLAEILSQCGEVAIHHFLRDLHDGRDFDETVADYCRLNPAIVKELLSRMHGTGGAQ